MSRFIRSCLLFGILAAASFLSPLHAETADPWWKHAVIYELYPRSFQDTNSDGVGDLNGITSRLDYLKDLGVDAIWITPAYPSPQIDFGYDISDYTAIDPQFGTMGDMDNLLREARKRDLRIIMDFVPNHTSDQIDWFKESRSSKTNRKRNWYIWRDGKPGGGPPNNWQSWFGHSAWQPDPQTQQYYYHHFYVQQPDLNWRNPEVERAMFDVMRFWLDRGVSGFRIDAVSRLFEDPNLHDDPILPGQNAFGDPNILHQYTDNLPEVHDVLRRMRNLVDSYPGNPVLISEADEPNVNELTKMYGHDDEVQLPMDFQVADVNQLSAPRFRELLDQVFHNSAGGQPHYFFSNHDQPRAWDRYGDGMHNDQIARLMATLLLTTGATPQMYYGEEIGMRTTEPTRVEDVKDPVGKLGWPKDKGRDGERTPMQWDDTRNAGFSKADTTWLPVPPSASQVNVAAESKDPDSMLNFYKTLIQLRRTNPALRDGEYIAVNVGDKNILSYLRRNSSGESVLIALNMSASSQTVGYDLSPQGVPGKSIQPLMGEKATVRLDAVTLPAFGVLLGKVK